MRVIAIDPGYDRLGVAVMEKNNNKETVIFSTCITTTKTKSTPYRLEEIGTSLEKIFATYNPSAFAIEKLFFNKNIKTALAVAESRGVAQYIARKNHCDVFEYSPQQIKIAVTGYGKSDKNAVTMMIKKLVANVPENALDDEYDAIAVGVTHLAYIQR